jgi:alpha-glucosidase
MSSSQIVLKSPNSRITVELQKNENILSYIIKKDNEILLDTSILNITVNNENLASNQDLFIKKQFTYKNKQKILGSKSNSNYVARNYLIGFNQQYTKTNFDIEFSMSNEGVAFRYICSNESINHVNGENSTFKFPGNPAVWFAERKNSWKLKTYAGEFMKCNLDELDTISPMGPIQLPPLLFESVKNNYILLTEAALYNYSGMRLEAVGENTVKTNFTEGASGFDVSGDIVTPWRVLIIADDLNQLVKNDIISGLNPKPDKKLFDKNNWIKPGIALTRFFSKGTGTPMEEMEIVDIVSTLNLDYLLIDDGWEKWKNKWDNIMQICKYAKDKNVEVWAWKHSDEIIKKENNFACMRNYLDSLHLVGVKGIKVDFMNSENKATIDFEIALLEYAAHKKMMVNLHGCHKPTGESVRFPNELTREGIRGWELNSMKEGPISSRHNAVLPFTRCVLGNADYTPLCYTAPGRTTWAHQLATTISFTSPFLCIPEDPSFLINNSNINSFNKILSNLPTVWDETIVLRLSKVGELSVLARRFKKDWYVAVLNAGGEKTIIIQLDFLKSRQYNAEIFQDDLNAEPFNISGLNKKVPVELHMVSNVVPFIKNEIQVCKDDEIPLVIAENGGAFIKISLR